MALACFWWKFVLQTVKIPEGRQSFFYSVPPPPPLQQKKMLFQAGRQGTRPTFFEMEAAQQLPASLRATLTYAISVLALRRPFLHRVLDYKDEFFSLLMLVLETHSLRITAYASFSESLYGLRRRAVKIKANEE